MIDTLLALTKSDQPPLRIVTFLGVSVGVLTHLKNVPEEPSTRLPSGLKDGIIALYSNAVLMSKIPVPEHVLTALQDFISTFVSEDDLVKSILPSIERALLRAPENSLPGT